MTNSAIGSISGTNLPAKSNFQGFTGFDAITGKSNFDISEWMLMHLLAWLSGRVAMLAMLCKTDCRPQGVCTIAWNSNLQIRKSATYAIDALNHFGSAVDACLLVCILEPSSNSKECDVYASLEASEPDSTFAVRGDQASRGFGFVRCLRTLLWYVSSQVAVGHQTRLFASHGVAGGTRHRYVYQRAR